MIGIYFSGTGNTRYCVERFLHAYHDQQEVKLYSIEDPEVMARIRDSARIVLGYPVHFSNIPKIFKDFLIQNQSAFLGKEIFVIATMGLFSDDGTGCSARILKSYGALILGGLHLKMPDSIADEKLLKKTPAQNRLLINNAEQKIKQAVLQLKQGKAAREGLGVSSHLAGLFGQRLWFYHKTRNYTDRLHINSKQCIGCGKCTSLCPMDNLVMDHKTVIVSDQCTMCYRCINHCPVQAITLLGKKVVMQSLVDDYL